MHYKEEVFPARTPSVLRALYLILWITTILGVFLFYAFQRFGGREYWEFPPFLCAPLLVAWLLLMADYFRAWLRRAPDPPLYVWMWTTGIVFFLITFLEQNLWQVPWFRDHYLREVSVQWKSNGAMVGAWNQMIYGTALYLMTVISGDEGIARGRTAFLFWLLGLSNLMFNWGHHIYNVPTAGWIRHVAYGISMTEWIFFI
ncbi:MAG: cytochrome C oxidase subunit I, partial [Flavobacteriales bacterium]|nr:cytochrome C oxidase subunit I [Flavobacteriales bacterium]